jgi:hypothetical protein
MTYDTEKARSATILYNPNFEDYLTANDIETEHPRIIFGDELQVRAMYLISRALYNLSVKLEAVKDIRHREQSDIQDIEYLMHRFFPIYLQMQIQAKERGQGIQ